MLDLRGEPIGAQWVTRDGRVATLVSTSPNLPACTRSNEYALYWALGPPDELDYETTWEGLFLCGEEHEFDIVRPYVLTECPF